MIFLIEILSEIQLMKTKRKTKRFTYINQRTMKNSVLLVFFLIGGLSPSFLIGQTSIVKETTRINFQYTLPGEKALHNGWLEYRISTTGTYRKATFSADRRSDNIDVRNKNKKEVWVQITNAHIEREHKKDGYTIIIKDKWKTSTGAVRDRSNNYTLIRFPKGKFTDLTRRYHFKTPGPIMKYELNQNGNASISIKFGVGKTNDMGKAVAVKDSNQKKISFNFYATVKDAEIVLPPPPPPPPPPPSCKQVKREGFAAWCRYSRTNKCYQQAQALIEQEDLKLWRKAQKRPKTIKAFESYINSFKGIDCKGKYIKAAQAEINLLKIDIDTRERWKSILADSNGISMSVVEDFIEEFPDFSYDPSPEDKIKDLYEISHTERKDGDWMEFKFTSNLKAPGDTLQVPSYKRIRDLDGLEVEDEQLESDNLLRVKLSESGDFAIVVYDLTYENITDTIFLSNLFSIDRTEDSSRIQLAFNGGFQPYSIELFETETGASAWSAGEIMEGKYTLDKQILQELVLPGTYDIHVKDQKSKKPYKKGTITIPPKASSWGLLAGLGVLVIGALGGIIFLLLKRRKKKEHTIFDIE